MKRCHQCIPFLLLLVISMAACSDDTEPTADQGVTADKSVTADKGPPADNGTAGDKGLPVEQGTTADTGMTDDKGSTADAATSAQYFTFKGANYPVTKTAVYCSVVSKMYNIRTGSKKGGTGTQANAYAYFAAPGPPATGTYKVLGQGLTPPGAGEVRLMIADFSNNSFWYSKAGGTVTVTNPSGKATVTWTNKTMADQIDNTKTTTTSGTMTCYQ